MYKERLEDPSWFHRLTPWLRSRSRLRVARSILCVVVHDAIGYRPDNESRSARITAAGFVAITPNLFARWQGALHRQGLSRVVDPARPRPRRHLRRPRSCAVDAGVHRVCRCGRVPHGGLTRIGDGAQGLWRFGTVLLPAAATP